MIQELGSELENAVQVPAQPQSLLGDLGPAMISPLHLPHKVVVRTQGGAEPLMLPGAPGRKDGMVKMCV